MGRWLPLWEKALRRSKREKKSVKIKAELENRILIIPCPKKN